MKNKKVVLFDLDGTLLPMNQDEFVKKYFNSLIKKLAELGLPARNAEEQKALGGAIWLGIAAVMKNDGSYTNEKVFFDKFASVTGVDMAHLRPELDNYYTNEFNEVAVVCDKNHTIKPIITELKGRGVRVAVATNPLFPLRANETRLSWAGFELSEFEYCTCYENSSFCKPSLEYYKEILRVLGVSAEECVMVGNDVKEDMVARELGMDVFLITDYLINSENRDINDFPHGTWQDFEKYINKMI